ncbi:hypothetical protein HUJ04_006908 [Dendroctonus ponderosae]|nr:hypothetical protein HUJ04_006908 [Dendroctonus ponderosae]
MHPYHRKYGTATYAKSIELYTNWNGIGHKQLLSGAVASICMIETGTDSGAINHMTPNEHWLENSSRADVQEIVVANREKLSVKCTGDLKISTECNGKSHDIMVQDILCVPQLTTNFISISQLISKGHKVYFTKTGCSVYNKADQEIAAAKLANGVYKLLLKQENCMLSVSGETWHRRLAHINSQDLNRMVGCVDGLSLKEKV